MPLKLKNTTVCRSIGALAGNVSYTQGLAPSIDKNAVILIIGIVATFTSLIAILFSAVRKHVYKNKNALDTSFDAGGKVSVGLTATTVVSQWTWATTLLYATTLTSEIGISGTLWYASGAAVQILLFSVVSVQLKIRAPGAKTFLQVIRARFGKTTHKVFCVFALIMHVCTVGVLMIGCGMISRLVKGMSTEFAAVLVSATVGTFTLIGGLGATFYVSYFNTAVIYVGMLFFVIKVFGNDVNGTPLGSFDDIYSYIACKEGPSRNQEHSYLTFVSWKGLQFGILNTIGSFGIVFVDQAYWQSSVAAKPKQGVTGFLLAGLVWFALPFSFSTAMSFAYDALSMQQNHPLLSKADVEAGLIVPVVAQKLLGHSGIVLVLLMVIMAIISSGSAEVMAVSSILIYDVYAVYIKPYRETTDANHCILCGKGRGRMARPRDKCVCVVMDQCRACSTDDEFRLQCRRPVKPDYKCRVHGPYRVFVDYLDDLKMWVLLWTNLSIVPITITLHMMGVSYVWLLCLFGVITGSAMPGIAMTMFWERLTWAGMITGSVGGSILAVAVWLVVASTLPGGLWHFLKNTGEPESMAIGNVVAVVTGGALTVMVSIATKERLPPTQSKEIWENTRDIDNPLSPWTQTLIKELHLKDTQHVDNRPSVEEEEAVFKNVLCAAKVVSFSLTFLLLFLWPSVMVALGVLSLDGFRQWVKLSKALAYASTVFIVVFPLVNEAFDAILAFLTRTPSIPLLDPRRSAVSVASVASDASKDDASEMRPSTMPSNQGSNVAASGSLQRTD